MQSKRLGIHERSDPQSTGHEFMSVKVFRKFDMGTRARMSRFSCRLSCCSSGWCVRAALVTSGLCGPRVCALLIMESSYVRDPEIIRVRIISERT